MKFCSGKHIKGILLPHAPHTLDLFAGYMDSKVFYFWGPLAHYENPRMFWGQLLVRQSASPIPQMKCFCHR